MNKDIFGIIATFYLLSIFAVIALSVVFNFINNPLFIILLMMYNATYILFLYYNPS